jgi:hypothetical protein
VGWNTFRRHHEIGIHLRDSDERVCESSDEMIERTSKASSPMIPRLFVRDHYRHAECPTEERAPYIRAEHMRVEHIRILSPNDVREPKKAAEADWATAVNMHVTDTAPLQDVDGRPFRNAGRHHSDLVAGCRECDGEVLNDSLRATGATAKAIYEVKNRGHELGRLGGPAAPDGGASAHSMTCRPLWPHTGRFSQR